MAESFKFGHWGSSSEEILLNHFPLHRACRDGDVDGLSLLLKEAQHGIYVEDSFYGWTPAHWAAYFGKLGCLMKLLDTDMACDATTIRLMQTPAQIAAFAGQSHCLKWLIHCGAALDKQDYLKETAVHKAARTGSMECISLLVSHNARLYIRNSSGLRPSELAAACGYMDCARYLDIASAKQEDDAKGIFDQKQHLDIIRPSPHDVTLATNDSSTSENETNLRVTSLHMNGHGSEEEECKMEEEESHQEMAATQPTLTFMQNGHTNGFVHGQTNGFVQLPHQVNGHTNGEYHDHGDITLDQGISNNLIPVAGHKRLREETDDFDHKRLRRHDPESHGEGILNGADPPSIPTSSNKVLNGFPKSAVTHLCLNGNSHLFCEAESIETNKRTNSLNFDEIARFRHIQVTDYKDKCSSSEGGCCSSSSELEHQNTVIVEQGYDSMFYDSFVSSCNGS